MRSSKMSVRGSEVWINTIVSDNTPMGEEVKWLLKEGGGLIK